MSKPSRNWCVTWNNPPERFQTSPDLLKNLIAQKDEKQHISYVVWQLEQGENETKHFQMYFELNTSQRFTFLQKIFDAKFHCEPRKGTALQARAYCMKVETRLSDPEEYGVMSKGQGSRSDLEALVNMAKEGKTLAEAYDVIGASVFRYAKEFDRAKITFASKIPRIKPVVFCYWGESGAGKTHDAVGGLEPGDYFIKRAGKWWDGYEGQKVIIVDEITPGSHDYQQLLGLCDIYQFSGEIKGATVSLNPERIFLTSNFHPNDWFPIITEKKPLLRRIDRIVHYSGDYRANNVVKTVETFDTVPNIPRIAHVPTFHPPQQEDEIIEISSDAEESLQTDEIYADLEIPISEEL